MKFIVSSLNKLIDLNIDHMERGAALWQLMLKLPKSRVVLAANRQICWNEEKPPFARFELPISP